MKALLNMTIIVIFIGFTATKAQAQVDPAKLPLGYENFLNQAFVNYSPEWVVSHSEEVQLEDLQKDAYVSTALDSVHHAVVLVNANPKIGHTVYKFKDKVTKKTVFWYNESTHQLLFLRSTVMAPQVPQQPAFAQQQPQQPSTGGRILNGLANVAGQVLQQQQPQSIYDTQFQGVKTVNW